MIEIKPFDISNFDAMELKADCWAKRESRALIEAYAHNGPAWTLWHEDKIIMCGGVICGGWPGIADVWLIPSPLINQWPLGAVKVTKAYLDGAIKDLRLHRVQATIEEKDVKWIEVLGFEREGKLRKFGPNKEDKYIYARIS